MKSVQLYCYIVRSKCGHGLIHRGRRNKTNNGAANLKIRQKCRKWQNDYKFRHFIRNCFVPLHAKWSSGTVLNDHFILILHSLSPPYYSIYAYCLDHSTDHSLYERALSDWSFSSERNRCITSTISSKSSVRVRRRFLYLPMEASCSSRG